MQTMSVSLVCCCEVCSSLAEKVLVSNVDLIGPAAHLEFRKQRKARLYDANSVKVSGGLERIRRKVPVFPLLSATNYTRLLF